MAHFILWTLLQLSGLLGSFTSAQEDNPCKSFGVDFQDNGAYFQDGNSTEPFTFVSQFEGCEPDTCFNILVDPFGESIECSDTQTTPDDTPKLSTCSKLKNELTSGTWSVILMSNNGDGQPIAYQRDFDLSVGQQQTITLTPTITVPYTSTIIVNYTSTLSTGAFPFTTTDQTPAQATTRPPIIEIVKTTITSTPACTIPSRQPSKDPALNFNPHLNIPHSQQVLNILQKAAPSILRQSFSRPPSVRGGGGRGRQGDGGNSDGRSGGDRGVFKTFRFSGRGVEIDKATFLQERRGRMDRLVKRAPDEEVIIVNATDLALIPTVTTTVLVTSTTTVYVAAGATAGIKFSSGAIAPDVDADERSDAGVPIVASVDMLYVRAAEGQPDVITSTITITATTTPADSATACR